VTVALASLPEETLIWEDDRRVLVQRGPEAATVAIARQLAVAWWETCTNDHVDITAVRDLGSLDLIRDPQDPHVLRPTFAGDTPEISVWMFDLWAAIP